jgi:tetratricopeptide (TPR) repeat protein
MIIFLLIFTKSFAYTNGADDFAKAEKFYGDSKYEEALKIYLSLLEENEISSTIFYNIGNCYFKSGDYINALLYYEKSAKFEPNAEDVLMNMEITRARITDKSEEMNEGVSGWFHTIVNSRPADYWSYFAIGLSVIGSLFLFIVFFSAQITMKRMAFATAMVSFAFCIVFTIFSYYQLKTFTNEDTAIISEINAEVKSEPNEKSKTVFSVPGGMKIKILSEKDDWSEIILNSNVGWVKTETLKRI